MWGLKFLIPGPGAPCFSLQVLQSMIDHSNIQWLQCYQTRGLGAWLGYFWLPGHGQQSLTATLLLLTSWPEMSWNRAPLWKIVNFLSIQGDFEPFQLQWTDLSSIDRIKTSYGAIKGDYPQLPELDNLSFFCQIRWFLVNLPHKNAQN